MFFDHVKSLDLARWVLSHDDGVLDVNELDEITFLILVEYVVATYIIILSFRGVLVLSHHANISHLHLIRELKDGGIV
jgi:hypothetical protein